MMVGPEAYKELISIRREPDFSIRSNDKDQEEPAKVLFLSQR
jgi:hypothetical protein